MRRADQLHTTLGNRPGSHCFQFTPDFINDDDFGVMVFHRFDHDFVLAFRARYLHPAGFTDCRVRHIPITADLVGGIDDDHTLAFGQHTGGLAQHGGFTDSGWP